ncbi:MAG: TAXI family TRAP transporter solute-binding subunit [Dictyoglomi bacterium]|jgi:hypothetical protein|nr:TAXI family TRAP transporter solute-binding subunit [Dictyoglomota bacterium]
MKKLMTVLALILAVSMVFVACGGQAQQTYNFSMATGGTTGTYYPLGTAIAQVISDYVDNVKVEARSTGASVANINLLKDGQADMAFVQNDIAYYAYNGVEVFEGKKVDNIAGMMALYPEHIQIVTLADSGINSVADLKGKRVAVGAAGSGVEANAKQILEAYGLSFDDLALADHVSFKDAVQKLKNNQLDAAFLTAGYPTAAVNELAASKAIKLIPIDDEHAKALKEKYPFYVQDIIPAGTYKGVDEDVKTVAVKAILIVRKDIPEDIVYKMLDAIFAHTDEIAKAHAKGAMINLDNAVKGMSIPWHPGAKKFFEEKGKLSK